MFLGRNHSLVKMGIELFFVIGGNGLHKMGWDTLVLVCFLSENTQYNSIWLLFYFENMFNRITYSFY